MRITYKGVCQYIRFIIEKRDKKAKKRATRSNGRASRKEAEREDRGADEGPLVPLLILKFVVTFCPTSNWLLELVPVSSSVAIIGA